MNDFSPPRRVAIIGAGITGLTAAWHLHRAGLAPVVFERASQPGGAIGAVKSDGWLHELGPNSLLDGSPDVTALIETTGLGARRIYASPAAKQRYVVRHGRLVSMPASPFQFATTPLFSLRAKLSLLGEPWRERGPMGAEESVAEFVIRRLGREFLDYAINPFVGGVYAGDPARLSVQYAFPKLHALEQEHGSLIRGAIQRRNASGGPKGRIFSFPNGLGELPAALAARLGGALRLNHSVIRIRRREDDWQIESDHAGVRGIETFDAVIIALPADGLAKLQFEGVAEAGRLKDLSAMVHPAVASVFMGYRRDDVTHPLDGFGLLAPEVERRRILGTLFSSSLFPGRAPDGFVGLTSFVGGVRNPELSRLDDQEMINLVQAELSALVGVRSQPVFTHIQRWRRAIPQYELGHGRFKAAIEAVEAAAPGLFIGGNSRDGISLSNCILSGRRLGVEALAHISLAAKPAVIRPMQ